MTYSEDNTVPKTLWSATLIDILVDSIRMNRSEDQVVAAVIDLQKRQFSLNYIVNKVRRVLGQEGSDRLKAILQNHRK